MEGTFGFFFVPSFGTFVWWEFTAWMAYSCYFRLIRQLPVPVLVQSFPVGRFGVSVVLNSGFTGTSLCFMLCFYLLWYQCNISPGDSGFSVVFDCHFIVTI